MKVKVPCTCYAPVDFEYDETVDLAKNPEAANQIMAGSFMEAKCPKCGKVLHPEFPFTVKHEGKKIDIQFLPERMRDEYLRGLSKYCFKKDGRIVIGFPELAEKLKIINEGFDDRIIEVIKYYMVSKIEADQKPENEIRAFFECTDKEVNLRFSPTFIIFGGIMIYVLLLLVTKYAFHRIVTSELLLIVVWTMLETAVVNWLNSAGYLTGYRLAFMVIVLMAAFVISIILYVAYYRMEEMKAFYAAMVPLVTEAAAMIVLVGLLLTTEKPV